MVGVGEILWDVLPHGKQLGGAPANFAYHACQLGNEGVVVSCVGDDDDGNEIIETLNNKNITHSLVIRDQYPTGTVGVKMDEGGIPSYTIYENTAWDHLVLNAAHLELAERADVICYGTLALRNRESRESILKFISHTQPQCTRIYDINLRQNYYSKEIIEILLFTSTILKLNSEELEVVRGMFGLAGNEDSLLQQLCRKFDLALIVLTAGADGSRLFSLDRGESAMKAVPTEVVDTVGAGDSFTAAVATGLFRKMSLTEIHSFAAKVSAYVCSRKGATPELPSVDQLLSI